MCDWWKGYLRWGEICTYHPSLVRWPMALRMFSLLSCNDSSSIMLRFRVMLHEYGSCMCVNIFLNVVF